MSKIGKAPIELPSGVEVQVEKKIISVTGPLGVLKIDLLKNIGIEQADNKIFVKLIDETVEGSNAYWGLIRALLNNAINGVSKGYTRELEIVGVGYRVELVGQDLNFSVGYSHPVLVKAPEGIKFVVDSNTSFKVIGHDKQLVGQMAANIRNIRKPEPYKGKGIKYKDEIIKRKQGKAAKGSSG
jgi:large subunit ribosomal protein L6